MLKKVLKIIRKQGKGSQENRVVAGILVSETQLYLTRRALVGIAEGMAASCGLQAIAY